MTDQRARVLGDRYELGPVIGRGGMGRVHRAHDRRLDREVAVKVLSGGHSGDPVRAIRFEREVRANARVSHPNVVAVYDEGTDGDELYFVMECLPGRSLADEVAQGPLSTERVRRVALDLLTGLAAAHREGILHRDIKPANVLLTSSGGAKLSDFGIAKTADTSDLTQVGGLVGTAPYLSPERLRGEPATASSDLYAVGAVLFEALTGRHPYAGDNPVAIAHAMATAPACRLAALRPDVDTDLADAVDRSLSRDPAARFGSASAMADAIRGAPSAVTETMLATGAPTEELVPAGQAAPQLRRGEFGLGPARRGLAGAGGRGGGDHVRGRVRAGHARPNDRNRHHVFYPADDVHHRARGGDGIDAARTHLGAHPSGAPPGGQGPPRGKPGPQARRVTGARTDLGVSTRPQGLRPGAGATAVSIQLGDARRRDAHDVTHDVTSRVSTCRSWVKTSAHPR